MDAATLYTLIIVTQAGAVHLTPGIKSLDMCQEAKQVAETGRTIAEEKAYWQAVSVRQEKERSEHPGVIGFSVQEHFVQSSDTKFAKCVIDPENK